MTMEGRLEPYCMFKNEEGEWCVDIDKHDKLTKFIKQEIKLAKKEVGEELFKDVPEIDRLVKQEIKLREEELVENVKETK